MNGDATASSSGWKFNVGLVGMLVLIGVTAWFQELVTGRSQNNQKMEAAARAVQILPDQFAGWTTEPRTMSDTEIAQTGTKAYYSRFLRSQKTAVPLSVMLLCGKTRELSVHPPTVCFEGLGLEVEGEPQRVPVPAEVAGEGGGELMAVHFKPSAYSTARPLYVYWGWSRDGRHWEAPSVPRLHFAGAPYLYKIYVVRDDPTGKKPASGELCDAVLRDFLPELHAAIDKVSADGEVATTR
jgi:hypothetical protein